jgi:type II secretory pathway component GspD/PulD (secretin)
VDTVLTFNQSKTSLSPGPDTAVKGALESINIQGMRPKAAANFINYLLRTGKAKVLSCPTVVAINGQQSVITSVDNLSYKAYSDTGTSTSKLGKQAGTGVSLTITPTITEETLTLSMNATVNSLVSWAAGNEPIINTRTTTATVVLKDGELFTMSGLKRDTIAKEDERVPILGSCPLIGYAFRHEIDVKKTSEIVILLTPHKVTASTGVLERERQLLNETKETVDKRDTRAGMQTFYDRVILNVKE